MEQPAQLRKICHERKECKQEPEDINNPNQALQVLHKSYPTRMDGIRYKQQEKIHQG